MDAPQNCEASVDSVGSTSLGCTEFLPSSTGEHEREMGLDTSGETLEKEAQELKMMVKDTETRCTNEEALDVKAKQSAEAEFRRLQELQQEVERTKASRLKKVEEKERSCTLLVGMIREGAGLAGEFSSSV